MALVPLGAAAQSTIPPAVPDSTSRPQAAPADTISDLYSELDELVVSVKKEAITSDGSKLTYDLDQDPATKGQTLLDVLRKTPMVSVDGDDKIYIKGQQNFKIYVNGREDPMLSANASTVLKAMPAEAVSKIEVINEPGAKYDAEGLAGILNLITERKQSRDGYTANLSLSGSNLMASGSAYGRLKYGRVTADAGIDYTNSHFAGSVGKQQSVTTSLISDRDWQQRTEMDQKYKFDYLGARFNLSWDISDSDLFTAGGSYTDMGADLARLDVTTSMISRAGDLQWKFRQFGHGHMGNGAVSANTSYKRLIGDKGQNFIAAYAFDYGKNSLDLNYDNENVYNYPLLPDCEQNVTDNISREHTATLDYTLPLADGRHTVEAGAKGVLRHNTADSRRYTLLSATASGSQDGSLTRQLQNVYAAYAVYTGVYGPVAAKAGIRYEHTYMAMDFIRGEDIPDFSRHLDDWVPSGSLTYSFDPVTNLRLGYQMRISRPTISQVNPFAYQMMENYVQMGNPYLSSQRNNTLSLTFSKFQRVFGGSIGLDASQSNNTIEEYTYWEDNVQYQVTGNYGRRRSIGLNGFFNWNINPNMSLNASGNAAYTHLTSRTTGNRNHAWNGSWNASYTYSGPLQMRYSAYYGQSTGDITLQGRWHGWKYYGVSVSKAFFADKSLNLTLNASNFLQKYSRFHQENQTATHRTEGQNKHRNWNVGLSATWTFGKLQDRVKQTGAQLDNDDAPQAQSKGGTGISL